MAHRTFVRTLRAQWLGQRLRSLRKECGLTLNAVAEFLNRDRSALGRYERAEWAAFIAGIKDGEFDFTTHTI